MADKNKTYNLITIGCQMNRSDSERLAAYLEDGGYESVKSPYGATLVILVTCGVRQSAEDRVYGLVPRIREANPSAKIIISGCLSQRNDVKDRLSKCVDHWLPIDDMHKLGALLGIGQSDGSLPYLEKSAKRANTISAFVPIGNGCDNYCSYCVVPYARGREKYRSADAIIAEVKRLVEQGYKEITLIAQNVNSYRDDGKCKIENGKVQKTDQMENITNIGPGQVASYELQVTKEVDETNVPKYIFTDLLKELDEIPGDFWLRFATSHPKDLSDELIQAMATAKHICRHLHLPVQAGDDEILRAMNRRYTSADYLGLVRRIRAAMPDIALTTDVIVGFPGESEVQFNNTVSLFNQARFDLAYIAPYSPRPGTAAAKFKDNVSVEEKERRVKELTETFKITALANNKNYIGRSFVVLVETKKSDGKYFGRTMTNKTVLIETDHDLAPGSFQTAAITEAIPFGMRGVLNS